MVKESRFLFLKPGRLSGLSLFDEKEPFCENLVSQMRTCFSYSDI